MKQLEGKDCRSRVDVVKVWVETIQGIATILAIIAGGYWFYLQRLTRPEIKLEQTVTQRALAGEQHKTLIAVEVRVTNTSKVKVNLDPGKLVVTQVNPIPADSKAELLSLPLKGLTLEPGESDQGKFQEIIVMDSVKTIESYIEYKVPRDRLLYWKLKDNDLYWKLRSLVDIDANAYRAKDEESLTGVHKK